MSKKISAVIIGASGYTGAELVRLLAAHPHVSIKTLVADSSAGQEIGAIYPHLRTLDLPRLVKIQEVDFAGVDVAFCALPHATSQQVIAALPGHVRVIDLSADFRLHDVKTYEQWYHTPHTAPDLQKQAVYGLTEIRREQIRKARLVACPGCYPTSILLPLLPLLADRLIEQDGIIADAKSGITGAGRSAKTANLFAEVNESVRPYGIGGHRHVAEIEQELGAASGGDIQITFTPQVVPMNRGIASIIYARLAGKTKAEQAKAALLRKYEKEPFVTVCGDDYTPATRDVLGTNRAMINLFADRIPGRIIIVSVIDNLLKGASGQAVQNMNLICGFDEATGLKKISVFP